MSKPYWASDTPFSIKVEAGKTYYWCACGRSKTQPFCDGTHQGSEFSPVVYQAEKDKKVFFCGCKATGNQPLCDGSHQNWSLALERK